MADSIRPIGENAAQDFFETMIYMATYDYATKQIQEFTKDIDNKYVKEALQGSLNILVMGFVFLIIQRQEKYIEKIFDWMWAVLIPAITGVRKRFIDKLKGVKGIKLFKKLSFLKINNDELVVKTATDVANVYINARNTASNSSSVLSDVIAHKNYMIDKERLHLEFGSKMAQRYNETLLFKLLTASFTAQDKEILKRILGTYDPDSLDIEDLNKISSFMFVKDSDGNIVGLSEAFLELINGIGYVR